MLQNPKDQVHPGIFIKKQVIPSAMSVTEAAKRLGVGRPALSKLLNARASLSADMAFRLEKTFGADRQELLDLQGAFDRHARRSREKSITAHAYVPHFLTIKAQQIHDWADNNLEARQLLPVLLRKLIRSTGVDLRRMDFPGYDNAERKGWDGLLEAGAATPWIPEGRSCWEFGVEARPARKAERDYANRTRAVSSDERREYAFVFVTTRNWPGKNAWKSDKEASGAWKAVRAFDASDLEQWLEESIPAQIWIAEKLVGMDVNGIQTLDQFWERWSSTSDPSITHAIFEPSITSYRETLKEWLEKESEHPLVVTAESMDEAIAFLACLFQDDAIAAQWGDLPAVFKSAQDLRKLAASSARFIPIASTDEAARELAGMYRRLHCIVVCPRNALKSRPNIKINVDLLNHYAFVKTLESMGIAQDEAERLARESGCSPTILRRRLSKFDAIRTPEWARDPGTARNLIPMALTGVWNVQSSADREVLEVLANRSCQEIEISVAHLLQFNDSPVWSAGVYRGVVSKMDALFAIKQYLIEEDLNEFISLAKHVLLEVDPALDLPEDRRWAAEVYGKSRKHSSALRTGICESLVILAVHGNNLFQDRLGIDVEKCVRRLIRELLTPLTLEKLLSHGSDLPRYAEAAPDEFLSLLEADLQQPEPVTLGLLKPIEDSLFNGNQRPGLLWALECLAWKRIGRVSSILAQLSRTAIDDNWANKPIASLKAIYRSWMPQTAASLEERMMALETLTQRYPDIGWQICLEQIKGDRRFGFPSYPPRWRSDASGAGQPVSRNEILEFERKALEIALAWPKHDQRTLGDLIEKIRELSEEDQAAVWDRIVAWTASTSDNSAKAELRERIRRFAFTRLGHQRGLDDATRDWARSVYEDLQPDDLVTRHAWLFASPWVEFSADDSDNEDIDYAKHMERIDTLRRAAMREIWTECGFEGATMLLSRGSAADVVGNAIGPITSDEKARVEFLRQCLSVTGDLVTRVDGCIQGFLTSIKPDDERRAILSAVAEGVDPERTARLFRCAPFGRRTWCLLDGYGKEVRDRYWHDVLPIWGHHDEAEVIELIDRLLEAQRPRAAFHAVRFDWQRIETSRLKRLLFAVATVTAEPGAHYRLDAHGISEALKSLDTRTDVSEDEMAQLEFMYIQVLDDTDYGIPNLERQIAKSPEVFFQALAFVFKRRDYGEDPPGLRIEGPQRREEMAVSCHELLERLRHIPGTGTEGTIDADALSAWVMEVRRLCAEHDCKKIGDQYIGQLLSRAPADDDGFRPCRAVCDVMEGIGSPDIGEGFRRGVYNSGGTHGGELDGRQEHMLAERYRDSAEQRIADYPYVSHVLESIADNYDRDAKVWEVEAEVEKRRRV